MSRVRDIANILSGGSSAIATDAEIPSYLAGKNFVVNGNFDFWQRGTTFTLSGGATTSTYTADRWASGINLGTTVSRVSAVNPESSYALRIQRTSGNTQSGDGFINQVIESSMVQMLAGKTVTLSFYLRKGADFSGAAVYCVPRFGTGVDEGVALGYGGGWAGQNQLVHTVVPTTTSVRYSKTFTVPAGTREMMLLMGPQSMSGTAGTNDWIEFEQVQLEIGSITTGFSRAGGTVQGELSTCQRYYTRLGGDSTYGVIGTGIAASATEASYVIVFPVPMRIMPASVEFSLVRATDFITINSPITNITLVTTESTKYCARLYTGATTGLTAHRPNFISNYNSANGYLAFSAEL
jgi:hypothetical protein